MNRNARSGRKLNPESPKFLPNLKIFPLPLHSRSATVVRMMRIEKFVSPAKAELSFGIPDFNSPFATVTRQTCSHRSVPMEALRTDRCPDRAHSFCNLHS